MAKVDLEAAKAAYPSCGGGVDMWMDFFRTSEGDHAFARMLYDMLDEILAIEEKERGVTRIGRRPARKPMTLAEIERRLFPTEFTNDPFSVAVAKLWPPLKTQEQFVRTLPITQPTLSRILSGKRPPTMQEIEIVADGLNVQSAYFAEWRSMYIAGLISGFLLEAPHRSIAAVKQVRRLRPATRTRS